MISNVLAVKIVPISLPGIEVTVPAAVLIYALTFVINDVVAEIWGQKRMNWLVFVGFMTSVVVAFFVKLAIWLTSSPLLAGSGGLPSGIG